MTQEFIPYEQALELKELGFDEECFQKFMLPNMNEFCKHPLYQQAFRWFREKYQLDYWVRAWWEYDRTMFIGYETLVEKEEHCGTYRTYEQAELACLKKLIEIVKNK